MSLAERAIIGESFVGDGAEAAHVNVVVGRKGGPVETAWATALATPRMGHAPFVTVIRPNVPVLPLTLFVNKAAMQNEKHGNLTWGAAQAGVASGVAAAVAEGLIPADEAHNLLCIAAVWVNPDAGDEEAVFANNRTSARNAIEAAVRSTPGVEEMLEHRDAPANPFYSAGSGS